jgi:hypothetical protein
MTVIANSKAALRRFAETGSQSRSLLALEWGLKESHAHAPSLVMAASVAGRRLSILEPTGEGSGGLEPNLTKEPWVYSWGFSKYSVCSPRVFQWSLFDTRKRCSNQMAALNAQNGRRCIDNSPFFSRIQIENCSLEKTVLSLADKKCDKYNSLKDLGNYMCNLFIQCNLSITALTEEGGWGLSWEE